MTKMLEGDAMDGQFEIIYESKKDGKVVAVRPEPYPRVAYNKDCDWIKSPTKGEINLSKP